MSETERIRVLAQGSKGTPSEAPKLSARERSAIRGAQAPKSLKGYSCKICSALGDHFETDCPDRGKVGVPQVLQKPVTEDEAAAPPTKTLPSFCVDMSLADLPADYVPAQELQSLIRRHESVPHCLRCAACSILCVDPVYLPCCDVLVCMACLGPIEAEWRCSDCDKTLHDRDWFVVGALRAITKAWEQHTARRVDKYSEDRKVPQKHRRLPPPDRRSRDSRRRKAKPY